MHGTRTRPSGKGSRVAFAHLTVYAHAAAVESNETLRRSQLVEARRRSRILLLLGAPLSTLRAAPSAAPPRRSNDGTAAPAASAFVCSSASAHAT